MPSNTEHTPSTPSFSSLLMTLRNTLAATDPNARKAALKSACDVLSESQNVHDSEVLAFAFFLISRLSDWASVGPACEGLAIVCEKFPGLVQKAAVTDGSEALDHGAVEMRGDQTDDLKEDDSAPHQSLLSQDNALLAHIGLDEVSGVPRSQNLGEKILKTLLKEVHAPSFAQPVRHAVLRVLLALTDVGKIFICHEHFSTSEHTDQPKKTASSYAVILAQGIFLQTEDERDPRNLVLSFDLLKRGLQLIDGLADPSSSTICSACPVISSSVLNLIRTHISDSLVSYFPLRFSPKPEDPFKVSPVDLKQKLHSALRVLGIEGLRQAVLELSSRPEDAVDVIERFESVGVVLGELVEIAKKMAISSNDPAICRLSGFLFRQPELSLEWWLENEALLLKAVPCLSPNQIQSVLNFALEKPGNFCASLIKILPMVSSSTALTADIATRAIVAIGTAAGWEDVVPVLLPCIEPGHASIQAVVQAAFDDNNETVKLALLRSSHRSLVLDRLQDTDTAPVILFARVLAGRESWKFVLNDLHLSSTELELLSIADRYRVASWLADKGDILEFLKTSKNKLSDIIEFFKVFLGALPQKIRPEVARKVLDAILIGKGKTVVLSSFDESDFAIVKPSEWLPVIARTVRSEDAVLLLPKVFAAAPLSVLESAEVVATVAVATEAAWLVAVSAVFARSTEVGVRVCKVSGSADKIANLEIAPESRIILAEALRAEHAEQLNGSSNQWYFAALIGVPSGMLVSRLGKERIKKELLSRLTDVYCLRVLGSLIVAREGALEQELPVIVKSLLRMLPDASFERSELNELFVVLQVLQHLAERVTLRVTKLYALEAVKRLCNLRNHPNLAIRRQAAAAQMAWLAIDEEFEDEEEESDASVGGYGDPGQEE